MKLHCSIANLVFVLQLHEYINDVQFEIFKSEQLALELNSVLTAAIFESDLVNKGKKKVLEGMVSFHFDFSPDSIDPVLEQYSDSTHAQPDSRVFKYSKQLAAQKSDMYAEYRERTVVLAKLCEQVSDPVVKAWQKVRQVIKASVILTKQAVSDLTPDCPLYPIFKEELRKADTSYSQEEDSLEQLGQDSSIFVIIEQIDQVLDFFLNVSPYLLTEAQSMTANMELNEIIRSWRDCHMQNDACD
ncbi:unnamed protein product [Notodromas monacha]|uniref:Uncharacterized protein n=1 Tax=Notodromas monacha TaxID=399045 RepID=A0A7R9BUN3_9CRUS|nr:unnamed protein product [Notodromas monacha]CAG0922059.1 unnamed protein product [Notodromas monacha]